MYSLQELCANAPVEKKIPATQVATAAKEANSPIFIVLDDDPTGTQSVANLPVLTKWEPADLRWALDTGAPAIYVMTNSRSLDPEAARRVNEEVVAATYAAAGDQPVAFVSRSDSTLRGHYPLEPDTLAAAVKNHSGQEIDGVVLVPAFSDAGRITVNAVHYAGNTKTGFVPVGETEFAKDATFGYQNSSLPAWVEEKTAGRFTQDQVITISLADLRSHDLSGAVAKLMEAEHQQPIVVDCVSEDDLRLLSLALIAAEEQGKTFVYRVGPPFVRARIGQAAHEPLSVAQIQRSKQGIDTAPYGLVVIGSHVQLTTRQLQTLVANQKVQQIELDVQTILGPDRDQHLKDLVRQISCALDTTTVVFQTSRKLITGTDGADSLAISRKVSAALVQVVREVLDLVKPAFVIAKGGITSSDVASKGLEIRHALVVGPMLPGIVSLWSAQDGPAAGIPYIVFAGNVGDDESLNQVTAKLLAAAS